MITLRKLESGERLNPDAMAKFSMTKREVCELNTYIQAIEGQRADLEQECARLRKRLGKSL